MCSPELVHFGRYNLNPQFNPAEARSVATSRDEEADAGYGLIMDPQVVFDEYRELLVRRRAKWFLANNPADDNIYAPSVRDLMSEWERFWADYGAATAYNAQLARRLQRMLQSKWVAIPTLGVSWAWGEVVGAQAWVAEQVASWLNPGRFVPMGQTIWEILKECELRHPGWISQPRPYGTRMTLFFGVPDHRYWADEISGEEILILRRFEARLRERMERLRQLRETQGRRARIDYGRVAIALLVGLPASSTTVTSAM